MYRQSREASNSNSDTSFTSQSTSPTQESEYQSHPVAACSSSYPTDLHLLPGSWGSVIMQLLLASALACLAVSASGADVGKRSWAQRRQAACPDYRDYAARPHPPYSSGPHALPFQRPVDECRLFKSKAVDDLIGQITGRMSDPDLARLFENAFPNTLDTTVRWHVKGDVNTAQSFIVTGDINAQWLRDCV